MDRCKILKGDNRRTLRRLPANSLHCVITSPPYWSVRDYQTPVVEFPRVRFTPCVGLRPITVPKWGGQMGLEPEPWMFIGHLLLSFRALRRVLRDDGTLWVNIGDTYYTGAGACNQPGGGDRGDKWREKMVVNHHTTPNRMPIEGYKPKDLVGIPWMFAKAMQAEGWTLRGDIVWHKPNPMPGSQKDRPTTAHEYLFLFSKSETYFYDSEAIKEKATSNGPVKSPNGWNKGNGSHATLDGSYEPPAATRSTSRKFRQKRSVWTISTRGYDGAHFATFPPELVKPCILAGTSEKGACPHCGAPWQRITTIDPDSKDENDTVTGDTKTVGWRPGCVCGSGAELLLQPDDFETFETPTGEQLGEDTSVQEGRRGIGRDAINSGKRLITKYEHRMYAKQLAVARMRPEMERETAELKGKDAFEHYLRTDRHGARPIPPDLLGVWLSRMWLAKVELPKWDYPTPIPCTVGDLFAGSGTVGEVAIEFGRSAVLCELAEHYLPLIEQRTNTTPGLPLA